MAIQGVTTKCWIVALFVRDDGKRFVLGDGAYEFNEAQQHFVADTLSNDVVEIQGNDGVLLAGQVRRAATQNFDGYVADFSQTTAQTEDYRRDFIGFFAKNHFYTVIYVLPDGRAVKRQRGFLVDAPEVQEIRQSSPRFHVALGFEDVNYYEYMENSEGEEIYSGKVEVGKSVGGDGGLIWGNIGVVWDNIGAEWEIASSGGPVTVTIDASGDSYPIWTIEGVAVNPTLENLNTQTKLVYNGAIAEGQTLVIDMYKRQALLNGLDVTGNLTGQYVLLQPGNNRLIFSTDGGDTTTSTLEWNTVVA